MKIAHFFIDHPRFAAVLSVFITIAGLVTMFLPIAQYPSIVPPTIDITTRFPGANADTIARTVATPLEQAVNGVENMDYITSQSTSDGAVTITVYFKIGSDPNIDLMLTRNRVEDVLSRLPPEVQAQGVHVNKTIKALVLGVHVYSPDGSRSPEYLYNYMLANKDKTFAGAFTLFNSGAPSMKADIDREKAEKLGLTPTDIFSTIGLYLGSQYVNDFNFYGRTYPVYVQADQQFRSTTAQIGDLKVRNAAGQMVPISTVTRFESETRPYRVPRYNLYNAAEIIGTPAPGVASGTAIREMERLADQTLPAGIGYEWTDLAHQQQSQRVSPTVIFLASALFVFLVLAAQYESWKIPLAILMIIPMCLLASSTGLHLRTMPIDILAQIGFVVLLGLAAKNAILIVEFARHHQDHEGVTPEEAAILAARERLRPILMTSMAFIAGVFPLVIAHGAGSEMRQAMGTAVFAGMIGVTVFGLAFTPAFYTVVRKLGARDLRLPASFTRLARRFA